MVLSNSGNSCIRNLAVPNDPTAEMQMDTCICQESGGSAYQQSGIISHWFYLLTHGYAGKGCDGKCYSFPAIPIDSAAKLIYNCEMSYFYEDMDFPNIIRATIEAAEVFSNPSEIRQSICGAWNVMGASTCGIDEFNDIGIEQYGLSFSNVNNGVYFVGNTIVIDSLQTLNLSGTIHLNDSSRIIVRPGGTLVVDGGTLTNACDGEMWQGIIVEGNRDMRQIGSKQGAVYLTNATIENARTAISTKGFEESTWWYKTGGIIQATNTLFRNNRRTAEFLDYENHKSSGGIASNASYFTRCTFTIDDDNLFAENDVVFKNHVSLWKVRGVKFNGCTFRNETATTIDSSRGKAIYTEEAGFIAQRVCPQVSNLDPCGCFPSGNDPVTRCSFEGFFEAVHASNALSNYDITIDNCDFAQNYVGVELDAADNARVSFCDFDLTDTVSYCGLELNNSTGYTVEENMIHKSKTNNVHKVSGIVVNESGAAENVIRKNSFSMINWGIIATGTNALNSRPRIPGLQFECNSFADCRMDISVSNDTIRRKQGSVSSGADNVFTGWGVSQSITLSNANEIIYYYSDGNGHAPYNSSTEVTPVNTATANACASTLCGIQVPQRGTREEALSQYRALAEEYRNLAGAW